MHVIITSIKKKFTGRLSKECFKKFSIRFIKNYVIIICIVFLSILIIKTLLHLFSFNFSNTPSTLDLSLLFTNLIILPIYAIASIKPIVWRLHDIGVHGLFCIMPFLIFFITACLAFKIGVSSFSLLPIPLFVTFTLLSLINGNKYKNRYGYPTPIEEIKPEKLKSGETSY